MIYVLSEYFMITYKNKDNENARVRRRFNFVMDKAFELFVEKGIGPVTMVEIADACNFGVATLYRYFGTKKELVIAIGTKKWQEYAVWVEEAYRARNGETMTAREELEFYIDSYLELYRNHKDILTFNSNFDMFVVHEHATAQEMKAYYDSVAVFSGKFHTVVEKAKVDGTIRTDIPEQDMFYGVMYTMLTVATKFAFGTVYPVDYKIDYSQSLDLLKQMFMTYYTR